MAQLGIRDKDYRPNQYINPMLISQGKEPAMGYGPYKIFDKNNPEHPDYKADDDDDEDMQLSLPIDYVHSLAVKIVVCHRHHPRQLCSQDALGYPY